MARKYRKLSAKTPFYPFTVFNAAQIEGFPAKETPDNPMTEIGRNDLVERFVALIRRCGLSMAIFEPLLQPCG